MQSDIWLGRCSSHHLGRLFLCRVIINFTIGHILTGLSSLSRNCRQTPTGVISSFIPCIVHQSNLFFIHFVCISTGQGSDRPRKKPMYATDIQNQLFGGIHQKYVSLLHFVACLLGKYFLGIFLDIFKFLRGSLGEGIILKTLHIWALSVNNVFRAFYKPKVQNNQVFLNTYLKDCTRNSSCIAVGMSVHERRYF